MWNLGLDEVEYCWVQTQFINTMQAHVKKLVWYDGVMTTKCFWERYYCANQRKNPKWSKISELMPSLMKIYLTRHPKSDISHVYRPHLRWSAYLEEVKRNFSKAVLDCLCTTKTKTTAWKGSRHWEKLEQKGIYNFACTLLSGSTIASHSIFVCHFHMLHVKIQH